MPNKLLKWGFAALLVVPVLLWLPLRPFCDTQNHENRTLAALPTAQTPVAQWPAAVEDWLGDHAPFRNELLTLKAGTDRLLHTLDSTDVLQGQEGWLFLRDVSDSASLSDYQGLTAYTPQEQATLAAAVQALGDTLAAKGSRLVLLFAPAKEQVYADKMPASIPVVSRPARVQALAETLRTATEVPVLYPLPLLQEAGAGGMPTYYMYDTHWNDIGAWYAAQQTLEALGKTPATWQGAAIDPEQAAPTDLANMCGSWAFCTDDAYWQVETARAVADGASMDDELLHYTGTGQGSLLLVRDSFGAALAPHLALPYASAVVIHGNRLSAETLATEQPAAPDAVVLEVAERYADTLPARLQILQQWADGLT